MIEKFLSTLERIADALEHIAVILDRKALPAVKETTEAEEAPVEKVKKPRAKKEKEDLPPSIDDQLPGENPVTTSRGEPLVKTAEELKAMIQQQVSGLTGKSSQRLIALVKERVCLKYAPAPTYRLADIPADKIKDAYFAFMDCTTILADEMTKQGADL